MEAAMMPTAVSSLSNVIVGWQFPLMIAWQEAIDFEIFLNSIKLAKYCRDLGPRPRFVDEIGINSFTVGEGWQIAQKKFDAFVRLKLATSCVASFC
jgi:hypothetical protein